jgi:radical SAM superfamily enzyme YgiQ (UPF0313 family)
MRAPDAKNRRKILCVFPKYAPSFGTFEYAYPMMGDVRGFMPPQGILVIASYLPANWEVRFVDENMRTATPKEFAWADAVFMSGMHVQRAQIESIDARAHAAGKITILGGPSVSGCPEWYPTVDLLHVGEMGDSTDAIIAYLDSTTERPPEQIRYTTKERLPLSDFPVPAYDKINLDRYFIGNIQFSSGCPYNCEFCDIPELYGNNPRLKTPEQIVAELDAMVASKRLPSAVYFVDDNIVGNRKAAIKLLPHLIDWQKRNNYPIQFACEGTLNIAKSPELLGMMREAWFTTIFCGIETPDPAALHAMKKDHNNTLDILEAIKTINSFGLEVVSGMIMGLDTDTAQTPDNLLHFINESKIPMLTINLLQALPRTPLWRRLEAEDRIYHGGDRETNVQYLMPYDDVVAAWRRTVGVAYSPEQLYARFMHNVEHTFPNRLKPDAKGRATFANVKKGVTLLTNLVVKVGLFGSYRKAFWKMAWPLLRKGQVEEFINVALVSHHLITFAREAVLGRQNASFYAEKAKETNAA